MEADTLGKIEVAGQLREHHGLLDIREMLSDLNELRKVEAYGESVDVDVLDVDDVLATIESYVELCEAKVREP